MKKVILLLIIMFNIFNNVSANYTQLAYDFKFKGIDGKIIELSSFKNKVIVVVNVASRCGFTNQYDDLQKLWVTGIPTNDFKQEPGTNSDIKDFCEVNFNITFPMSEKVNVLGDNSHPFFKWAKDNHGKGAIPKWNFHKIIIGKDGKIADTFSSITKPSSKRFINSIDKIIKN
jgi:glutathione peroxidase